MAGADCRWAERTEAAAVAGVAARALRDNPSALVISADPLVRLAVLADVFALQADHETALRRVATVGPLVVATAVAEAPGHCLATYYDDRAMAQPEPGPGAGDTERMVYFGAVMARFDPDEPHWHVGPVGVEPGLQGRGIGGAVLDGLLGELDRRDGTAWLETDKPENVRFYLAHGFTVEAETEGLGTTMWFLRRPPVSPPAP